MTAAGFGLSAGQIMMVLPHRPPMLQLDRVTHCAAALDALTATKALCGSDSLLVGPPGEPPYLAAPALIEGLAQGCGLLLRLRWLAGVGVDVPAFAKGEKLAGRAIPRSALADSHMRFTALARPGDRVQLCVRLVLSRGDMHRFSAAAHGETPLAAGEITLQFPQAE